MLLAGIVTGFSNPKVFNDDRVTLDTERGGAAQGKQELALVEEAEVARFPTQTCEKF